jgi:hypothetical protein
MSTALLTKTSFLKTIGTLGFAAAAAAESRITHWRRICVTWSDETDGVVAHDAPVSGSKRGVVT